MSGIPPEAQNAHKRKYRLGLRKSGRRRPPDHEARPRSSSATTGGRKPYAGMNALVKAGYNPERSRIVTCIGRTTAQEPRATRRRRGRAAPAASTDRYLLSQRGHHAYFNAAGDPGTARPSPGSWPRSDAPERIFTVDQLGGLRAGGARLHPRMTARSADRVRCANPGAYGALRPVDNPDPERTTVNSSVPPAAHRSPARRPQGQWALARATVRVAIHTKARVDPRRLDPRLAELWRSSPIYENSTTNI